MGMWKTFLESLFLKTGEETANRMAPLVLRSAAITEEKAVVHHVTNVNGGCFDDFAKAMEECHPSPPTSIVQRGHGAEHVVDAEACVKATAALRKCFARNPAMFKHQYLRIMDECLDQDVKWSPEQVKEEDRARFRWWTGMTRS